MKLIDQRSIPMMRKKHCVETLVSKVSKIENSTFDSCLSERILLRKGMRGNLELCCGRKLDSVEICLRQRVCFTSQGF